MSTNYFLDRKQPLFVVVIYQALVPGPTDILYQVERVISLLEVKEELGLLCIYIFILRDGVTGRLPSRLEY